MDGRDEKGKFIKGNKSQGGRPKGSFSLNDEIRKILEKQIIKTFPEFAKEPKLAKKKAVEILAQKIVLDSLKGDKLTRIHLWDHLEGKPPQSVNVGGQENNPVKSELTIINASEVINNKPIQDDEDE
jgi:hypothetical protein